MDRHGIKTMMCTPSRTPPPWVFSKYPEIINFRPDGEHVDYGFRYTVNMNHPVFIKLAKKIDSLVVSHYAKNKAVIAWQIDNEIGAFNEDVSDLTEAAFQNYLMQKYKSIADLNEKWGSHFWSLTFNAFSEIKIPGRLANPALSLEWNRFCSKTNVDFSKWRFHLIKKMNPSQWVTTNFQETRTTHTDIMELGQATDVYGTNFYHRLEHEFSLDYCRGARNELIILEQEASYTTSQIRSPKGLMRTNAYNSIAHGANGICFFRWVPARWGQEKYWGGILPHDRQPNWLYDEFVQFGTEMKKNGAIINQTRPDAEIAILMNYESRWASDSWTKKWNGISEAESYHEAIMHKNFITDGLQPGDDLSKYKLVIAPNLYVLNENNAQNIRGYVANGGVFCMTRHSAVADEYNKIYNQPLPAFLTDVAGIEINTFGKLETPLELKSCLPDLKIDNASLWEDEINIVGKTKVLATYNQGWLSNTPAITLNKYGKGYFIYVGTILENPGINGLINWLTDFSNIKPVFDCPEGIRAFSRSNDNYRLVFLFNTSNQLKSINTANTAQDLISGKSSKHFDIEPGYLAILKMER